MNDEGFLQIQKEEGLRSMKSGYKLIIELKNAVVECAEFHEKYCRINCTEQGKGIEM